MALTALLVLLAAFLIYVLLMPLELVIDSYSGRYYMRMGFLAQLRLEKDPLEVVRLHLKVLFLNFYWRPTDIRTRGRKKTKPTKHFNSVKKRGMTLARARRIIHSFRLEVLRLEIDTGNPVLNARLVPLAFVLGQRLGHIGINFQNRNFILLHLVNRPIDILKAFINLKIRHHGITL